MSNQAYQCQRPDQRDHTAMIAKKVANTNPNARFDETWGGSSAVILSCVVDRFALQISFAPDGSEVSYSSRSPAMTNKVPSRAIVPSQERPGARIGWYKYVA